MARPREFDPGKVLEQAARVFRAKGYEGASLDDLCAATSLSRSSLYAAFGGKRSLFFDALGYHTDHVVVAIAAQLSRPLPIGERLAGFLQGLIDQIVKGPGRQGCFIGNCAAEVSQQDRQAASVVRHNLGRIEATFHDAFARAAAHGELPPQTDVTALARFFMSGIQGLRLVGKANPDKTLLTDIAKVMLQSLPLAK